MKVLQCGDLFIRADRFEEYCEVFDIFLMKIEEYKPDLIVITGNTIKDITSANDVKLAVEFLTEIASKAKTLIYYEGCDIKIPNVNYLHKGITILYGIAWIIDTPICDENMCKIAIYKEKVIKRRDGAVIMASGRNRRLGPYSGALIQQSIIDGAGNYGFLLWDILAGTNIFVEVPNDRGYLRFKISEGVISGVHSRNPNFWDIHTDENSDFFKKQLSVLTKRYGKPKNVIINEPGKDLNIVDFIKNALVEKIDSPNKILASPDEILAIHNSYGFLGQRSVITLKEIYFDNLYCYGPENYINFLEFKDGLTGIVGENEIGKSALINIIKAGFYGGRGEIVKSGNNVGRIKLIYDKDGKEVIREVAINAAMNKTLSFDIPPDILDNTSIIKQSDYDLLASNNVGDLLAKTLNIDLKRRCKDDLAKLADKLKKLKKTVVIKDDCLVDKLHDIDKKLNSVEVIDIAAEKKKIIINSELLALIPKVADCHEEYKTKFELKEALKIKKFADSINIKEVIASMKLAEKEYEEKLNMCNKCDNSELGECNGFKDLKIYLDSECEKIKNDFLKKVAILKKYREGDCENIDKELYWHKWNLELEILNIKKKLERNDYEKLKTIKSSIVRKINARDAAIEKEKTRARLEKECKKSYDMLKLYCDTIDEATESIIGSQLEKLTGLVNDILKVGSTRGNAGEIKFNADENYKIYYKPAKSKFYHSASLTSGFRRFSISLALRLALWQLSQGTVLNALIIDEKISACDMTNIKLMTEFLENITTLPNMPKLNVIISHIEYIKCRMVHKIEIKNGEFGSQINCNKLNLL